LRIYQVINGRLLRTIKKNILCNYELNLVLKDGKRILVIDYEDNEDIYITSLREEAETLASALAISVWDATLNKN
jgi:hypothetical protein